MQGLLPLSQGKKPENKQKTLKHSNKDLDVDYHGNSQSFEKFDSAQQISQEKSYFSDDKVVCLM